MEFVLGLIAMVAILYAAAYRLAAEGLLLYMKIKECTPPNEKEIAECQEKVLSRLFTWYKPNK